MVVRKVRLVQTMYTSKCKETFINCTCLYTHVFMFFFFYISIGIIILYAGTYPNAVPVEQRKMRKYDYQGNDDNLNVTKSQTPLYRCSDAVSAGYVYRQLY